MVIYTPQVGITFPEAVGESSAVLTLATTTWQVFATQVMPSIPFVEGFTRYWVEWAPDVNFGSDTHVAGFIVPATDFNTPGDRIGYAITGFEPGSTWHFRAGASDSGESPYQAPEQWHLNEAP